MRLSRSRDAGDPIRETYGAARPRFWETVGPDHSLPATSPSKENGMSSLSDGFRKLADQIDEAEANVKAASSQDKAELQAKVNTAREHADERSAQLHAKAEEV